jgi:hypothetical protein
MTSNCRILSTGDTNTQLKRFTLIFLRVVRDTAHSNGCGPLPKKGPDAHASKRLYYLVVTVKHVGYSFWYLFNIR